MSVRTKFVMTSYEAHHHWNDPTKELRTLHFTPVVDDSPENKEFYDATPAGEIKLGTLNKAVWEQFVIGKEYYVDFTPADSAAKE